MDTQHQQNDFTVDGYNYKTREYKVVVEQQKHKKLKEKFKKFKKEIPPAGKTREELDKEWNKISVKCRSWRLHRELRGAKMKLGMQHIIPLIIATKVNV